MGPARKEGQTKYHVKESATWISSVQSMREFWVSSRSHLMLVPWEAGIGSICTPPPSLDTDWLRTAPQGR